MVPGQYTDKRTDRQIDIEIEHQETARNASYSYI
jgi:hypothetical protein